MGPRSASTSPVVLITGATSDIGRAIAGRLQHAGFVVAVAGRDRARVEHLVTELSAPLEQAFVADLSVRGSGRALVDECRRRFGRLDALVLGAALALRGRTALETSDEDFDRLVTTNLAPVHEIVPAAADLLAVAPCPRVVLIASDLAFRPLSGLAWYGATKAATVALARSLAVELGEHGVCVNAVCPGLVRTASSQRQTDFEQAERDYAERTPLRRIGEPDDVAGLVEFLLSVNASWLTGQSIVLDGGHGMT